MPSNHLSLCHPLRLLPSIFPNIKVFSNKSVFPIRWRWSFSFSISPSSEYLGIFSFGIDWLDLLAVKGTLKSLFQHHSSKALILKCSTFFMVQLPHSYMTTGETTALTRRTLLAKVFYSSASFSSIDGNRFLVSHLRTTTSHWRCVTPWLKVGPLRSTPLSRGCARGWNMEVKEYFIFF